MQGARVRPHLKLLDLGMRDARGRKGVGPVDPTYDLFEIFPDGSALWKDTVVGHEDAMLKLQELASGTTNEMRVMYVPTNAVIATMNAPKL